KRQRFSPEFKREAVRLLESGQKPATQLALELGVARNKLYQWQAQLKTKGDAAFHESVGRPQRSQMDRIAQLEAELKRVNEERDILKKAATYFAKELG